METVNQIETRYSEAAGRPITLAALARDWEAFATEVSAGYWGTVDDFTNDLTARDLLEEALQSLSEADRAWLTSLISPGDAKYREATVNDPSDRLLAVFRHDGQWWWRRVPRVLGELRADLGGASPTG